MRTQMDFAVKVIASVLIMDEKYNYAISHWIGSDLTPIMTADLGRKQKQNMGVAVPDPS